MYSFKPAFEVFKLQVFIVLLRYQTYLHANNVSELCEIEVRTIMKLKSFMCVNLVCEWHCVSTLKRKFAVCY